MLKLFRNICIWMYSTSCLFGHVTHAVPLEYFDDHEFSYDMDTAQSKVKYDPRQLSQQLKDQHNNPQERAAPCYSASNRYTHGQRVAREDPCEVCLCVDGEIFCWWKKCGSPKRRKFKLEKSAKLSKSKAASKAKQEQQHLRQKKKLEKKLRQQHWQQQQEHELQLQRSGARNKILTFPENLPSVLYYDYKTEDQHGFHHGNHEKQATSPTNGIAGVGASAGSRHNNAHDSISATEAIGSRESTNEDTENDDDAIDEEDADDTSSAIAAVSAAVAEEPASTEMKFGAKIHSAAEASKKISLQQTSTARITTPGAVPMPVPSEAFPNERIKDNRLNTDNQFISDHSAGDIETLSNGSSGQLSPAAVVPQNRTVTAGTQGETAFMLMQTQEVDHDGILRDGPGVESGDSGDSGPLGKYPLPQPNGSGGGATSFHSSFNDFSSEFNASAAVDLDLIMGHHNAHDAPIILEADSIVNVSSSKSSSSKQDLGGADGTNIDTSASNRNSSKETSALSTTTMASTTMTPEQECIVMGTSYKIGAILPQETGNCLQCICIEGATKDDTPRVTCSPHNCPPLVLPDLFDATGY